MYVSENQGAWRSALVERHAEHRAIIAGVGAATTTFVVCNNNRCSLEAKTTEGRGWGAHVSTAGWKPTGKPARNPTGKPTGGTWMSAGDGNRRRGQGSPSSSGNDSIFFEVLEGTLFDAEYCRSGQQD